nr:MULTISPECIES: SNF2-related protein [unclassified Corynebacterium]
MPHELDRSYASDHVGRFAGLLFDAQVEPKPHQVDAALFALQTPFTKGVILADEVGLGKTIEAGIVLSQYWAKRQRRILIISPSSLRQQWQQELSEKFALPATLMDSKNIDTLIGPGSGEATIWKALTRLDNGGMPNYPGRSRANFEANVELVRYVRNRASHQEPLIGAEGGMGDMQRLRDYLAAIGMVASSIDPKAAAWIATNSRIPMVLTEQPHETPHRISRPRSS